MHTGKSNLADFILNKKTSALLKKLSRFFARITVRFVVLGLCLSLILIPQQILAEEEQALPKKWKNISLKKMKLQVIDGDTFDADFNRNGRFTNPQERVRLLYVDTPELKKSHKGKDPKLGLPAKGFLRTVLSKTNAVLWVDPKNKTGNYGRLREEGKTVYSTRTYFVAKIQNAEVIDLSKYNGRFVRVQGKIKKIQQLRKGAQLIFLKHKRMKKGLPVISFENQRNWLGLQKIRKGDLLQIEGFATLYKIKQWQIKLHRAVLLN